MADNEHGDIATTPLTRGGGQASIGMQSGPNESSRCATAAAAAAIAAILTATGRKRRSNLPL